MNYNNKNTENLAQLFNKRRYFDEAQRTFALTLHLYGPKAYEFLRNKGVHLPHARTLRKLVTTTTFHNCRF